MTTRTIWNHIKVPLFILLAFLLLAMWVLFGRIFFGAFGWMVFILLFTVVPVIVIYGIVLTVIVAIRQRSVVFRRRGRFMLGVYVTLAALFLFGLAIPDGGDTKDSAGSALTVLMGDKSGEAALALSGGIAVFALVVAAAAAIASFVLVFFEKSRPAGAGLTADTLKHQG